MKQMLYKGVAICCVLFFSSFVKAGNLEETKVKNVAYAISSQAYIELNNQYGEIQVVTWEKDSFKLEATITASTDKGYADIDKLLNMVEVVCRGSETSVVISTEWTSGNAIWKRGKMDLKSLLSSEKKLEVSYIVYLPSKCRLTIENRFGDVYLPDYLGPLRVTLSHGDLRARDIADARSIYVKYGKALIKQVDNGLLKIDYGSLILDKADNISLQTKSSIIEILKVKRLAIKSKSDELRVDQVESLRGESSFSHIRVKGVSKLIDLNTTYGDVTVKEVKPDFELIRMVGSSTDYEVDFATGTQYQFNVFITGNKRVSFSQKSTIVSQDVYKDEIRYKGFYGSEKATPLVDIEAKSGYVNLYNP
ncbi:MAG: hypothetical protein JKY48_19200 [Flavobacteriales bacterium]|nr:hypothetical protein [Flavobacteriales bacterium]